jgi:hypothetical protein
MYSVFRFPKIRELAFLTSYAGYAALEKGSFGNSPSAGTQSGILASHTQEPAPVAKFSFLRRFYYLNKN